ncbi:CheA signal transduction histidine kinase [Thioalkalivibrio sp. ALE21]|uniref:chemotaxis protein CheA n=1 Tax=Thioalkalivibrio sp. ALE21 TaxID=1158175 RepID=UPI000D926579|nr:chemotaxis protein CheA [Thioalkalivibrio sp. ALE21]PYG03450.1 CheA signal transduction histidine kinase [Thioalkalivibrio sp. ALE21]
MSMDMSQFTEAFLEESFEGLEHMETELLALNAGDEETLHTIFRAAHSIKGGAGTFGFSAISEFTHGMETLLDRMRNGQQETTPEIVNLLLRAVDVLRGQLQAARDGGEADPAEAAEVRALIEATLGDAAPDATPDALAPTVGGNVDGSGPVNGSGDGDGDGTPRGWRIHFRPHADLLRTGNDPLRMFEVLEELGELTVHCDAEGLPATLEGYDPEASYLAWTLELRGDADRADIEEVFEWVEDECDLTIEPLETAGDSTGAHPPADPPPESSGPASAPPGGEDSAAGAPARAASKPTESSSMRVNAAKIDALIDMVGELVITQSMLTDISEQMEEDPARVEQQIERLRSGLAELERNTRELQESVMGIRMVPIAQVFNRFPRLVHDLSGQLGKQIDLQMEGELTEIDKTVLEHLGDPLVHLVRNAIDHGIEMPDERSAAGKDPTGRVTLEAYHRGGNVVIEIRDDGRGMNSDRILEKARAAGLLRPDQNPEPHEILQYIFEPGLSTAEKLSDLSGRGVGMDVVKKNIRSLGGNIELHSEPGRGSRVTIRLPLTLSIMDGQLLKIHDETFVIPLIAIVESLQTEPENVKQAFGKLPLYRLRDEYIPVVDLAALFGQAEPSPMPDRALLVVAEADNQRVALRVDDLLGQQQVVIKTLETNFRRVPGTAGATILGDGQVALILDVAGIARMAAGHDTRAA